MNATTPLPPSLAAAIQELLNLPPRQRLEIGEQLIASVEIDASWSRVAARRAQELRSGSVQGVSIDAAFEQAQRAIDAVRPDAS